MYVEYWLFRATWVLRCSSSSSINKVVSRLLLYLLLLTRWTGTVLHSVHLCLTRNSDVPYLALLTWVYSPVTLALDYYYLAAPGGNSGSMIQALVQAAALKVKNNYNINQLITDSLCRFLDIRGIAVFVKRRLYSYGESVSETVTWF